MKNFWKSSLPYVGTILVFVVISFIYFSPVLENKKLPQGDDTNAIGMAQEIKTFEKSTGEKTQWTNSMFGGMPAYQIKGDSSHNIFSYFGRFLRGGLPYHTVAILFMYLLGFYIFMLSMKFNPLLSLLGAISFAFGSYNIIIIIAGHITKAYAIALMAPVIGGVIYAYNKNTKLGALYTAIALGLEINYNHIQITYYLALLILIIIVTHFINSIKEKTIPKFVKTSTYLLVAAFLAILPNITTLWTTYEYGKLSIRGKSELPTPKEEKNHNGLDKDYALAWSLEPKGTFTLMVPNVVGGASEAIQNNKSALNKVSSRMRQTIGQQSQYWGGRPFTSGPVYAGAIICFLFILGLFAYKGPEKWWLIAGTILSVFLAWGKHFGLFTDFMFYYFPLYNKFRTVEMALVIASLTIPILALLTLREVLKNPKFISENKTKFYLAFGLTGGLSLLFYLLPNTFFSFLSDPEIQQLSVQKAKILKQNPGQATEITMYFKDMISNLKVARAYLLTSDALRSFIFILLGAGSLLAYSYNKLSAKWVSWLIIVLVLVDLWNVDKRYLNNDNFVNESKMKQQFALSPADKFIKNTQKQGDRVFAIYRSPFNDAFTSYHHQSIGGYHGAKLRRYQDIIDYYLAANHKTLITELSKISNEEQLDSLFTTMPVLNMLNSKFIIYNPNAQPIINNNAMGNAWFVKNIKSVSSPEQAIKNIETTPLESTAIINTKEFGKIKYNIDSINGNIKLLKYQPNKLTYEYSCNQKQLAVFSQIYYNKGWKAYIDNKETEILRANYILRALMLPKGEHKVTFVFKPSSYKYGQIIALISSLAILIILIIFGIIGMKKRK